MPILNRRPVSYKGAKDVDELIDNFRGGLNTLLAPTEISKNELVQADNLYLVGKGVPKKRGGTSNYFLTAPSVATGSQRVRGLKGVLFASGASGVNELLAVSDYGILVKMSGASYAEIPGYSYASGYNMEMVQAYNNVYLANGNNALTYYSGVTIFPFTGLSRPTSVTATLYSGATGTFTYSWRISATNAVGETLASTGITLGGLPQSVISTNVFLTWAMSTPTTDVVSYQIYGRNAGQETYLTSVNGTSNRFLDDGSRTPSILAQPPTADTTTGPIYKYQVFHQDKLVGANINGKPTRVVWSGGGPQNINKFHYSYGGGYVDINADSGEVITGLVDFVNRVVVFMTRSIWSVTFSADSTGIVIPNVKLVTRNNGCVSNRSICPVDNDVLFLSRRGVFGLGYEPQIAGDVLRTNEVSTKVRSFFAGITESQFEDTCAIYQDNKYRITRPDGKEIIFDRERLAWMGPNSFNAASPGVYERHYDGSNKEHLLFGDRADNFVTEYSTAFSDDKGEAITSRLITKKEGFSDPYLFKFINDIFLNFRNITGSPQVDIVIESRDGTSTTSKSFSVTASNAGTGWGFDKFGTAKFGTSAGAGSASASNDLVRRVILGKAARLIQLDIRTTGGSDNYELLSIKYKVQPIGEGILPGAWQV